MAILLEWDKVGEHFYETGTDHVVLYPAADSSTGGPRANGYLDGVAWNGCTGVTEKPSGGDETKLWADNIKYLSLRSAEDFGATITAYTYPDEWMECDGSKIIVPQTGASLMSVSQQPRKGFCLVYRTLVGNDLQFNDFGYKIHVLYGCSTAPSEKANSTVNENPNANEFSWEISTTPIDPKITINGKALKPTAHVIIDAWKATSVADKAKITTIEELLFGKKGETPEADVPAQILMPNEIYGILYPTQG